MIKAKNFFTRLLSILSVLIFLFGLFIFISVLNASAGKVPSVFGYSFLQIQTGSMEPEFPVGSVVIAKKVDPKEIKTGDVISFYSSEADIAGRVNTHRVVQITLNMSGFPVFTTKGDANPADDPRTVSSIRLVGKVVYNLGTVSGSVISVLKNPNVILVFIVIPLLLITFGEAINLAKLIVESKEEKKKEKNEQSPEEKN